MKKTILAVLLALSGVAAADPVMTKEQLKAERMELKARRHELRQMAKAHRHHVREFRKAHHQQRPQQ
jgi:hypothetical protein